MGLPFSGYVGEARMRLFTNYVFGNQNMANTQLGEGGGGGGGGGGGEGAETTFIDQLGSDTGLSVF